MSSHSQHLLHAQQRAVESMVSYVQTSNLFVALVPAVEHRETGRSLGFHVESSFLFDKKSSDERVEIEHGHSMLFFNIFQLRICNFSSWLTRGWCQSEMWSHALSIRNKLPAIAVHSAQKAELISANALEHSLLE